jgi:ABC-type antimicrobial peptide transport system, permease component
MAKHGDKAAATTAALATAAGAAGSASASVSVPERPARSQQQRGQEASGGTERRSVPAPPPAEPGAPPSRRPGDVKRSSMPVIENLRLALSGLSANKMRAALTMLGIIIGVGAVIAMIALGEGARQKTLQQIKSLGTNLLLVEAERRRIGQSRGRAATWDRIKIDDLKAFSPDTTPAVANVSPEIRTGTLAKAGNLSAETNAFGVWANWLEIRNYDMAIGRFFTADEENKKSKVVVLGWTVYQQLYPNGDDPTGDLIRVNNVGMRCIGVLAPKGYSGTANNDDVLVMPAGTAQKRVFNYWQARIRSFAAQAASEEQMEEAAAQIEALWRKRYDVKPGDPNIIAVRSQSEIAQFADQTGSTFTALLASIAGVSLLVGGIGIMNIMLVSVTERTREIGIRKAIGAKRRDILLQFLIESMTLSLLGGVIGIALGVGIALGLPRINPDTSTVLTVAPMVIAFGFSAAVGIFFGFYPAVKASKLDPIVALRYE